VKLPRGCDRARANSGQRPQSQFQQPQVPILEELVVARILVEQHAMVLAIEPAEDALHQERQWPGIARLGRETDHGPEGHGLPGRLRQDEKEVPERRRGTGGVGAGINEVCRQRVLLSPRLATMAEAMSSVVTSSPFSLISPTSASR
jgi:hypothetical protein